MVCGFAVLVVLNDVVADDVVLVVPLMECEAEVDVDLVEVVVVDVSLVVVLAPTNMTETLLLT